LPAGIFITGGGSGLGNIEDLAKNSLKLPSRIATINVGEKNKIKDSTWSVNGSIINNNSNQNIQVFRKKDGAVGTARISLSTENISKILQSASGSFDLKFSSKNSSDQNQI
jgi:hypothetical protein